MQAEEWTLNGVDAKRICVDSMGICSNIQKSGLPSTYFSYECYPKQ